jgi:hypothetical protein
LFFFHFLLPLEKIKKLDTLFYLLLVILFSTLTKWAHLYLSIKGLQISPETLKKLDMALESQQSRHPLQAQDQGTLDLAEEAVLHLLTKGSPSQKENFLNSLTKELGDR